MALITQEPRICQRCGGRLPADAPGGNCLACLLRLGLDIQADDFGEESAEDLPGGEGMPRISNYRVTDKLGEGGFGVVYAAEQLQPVRRNVAIKVIKPGMDSCGVIAHFALERQALAVMDHPGIARVWDAGVTEAGRAFFAMERVTGAQLIEYCDTRRLGIEQRVEVFIQLCQAVQHAHQKGIIHRDLKPGNVIVTGEAGAAVPKVIDFGIAKAVDGQRLGEQTIITAFEPFVGTPAYMSPEQAEFGGTDIDTRSDIYSLGVMLYELLAGTPPFDGLKSAGLDETRRRIREEIPPRPSALVAGLPIAEQKRIAELRSSEPARLIRLLRGDLDWVTMKALEKDRGRRYASAAGFAADLRRCLDAEPVSARPPSAWYRLGRFARRNKATMAAAAAILAAVSAAAIFCAIAAVRARQAQQQSAIAAGKTIETADFLVEAFGAITPENARAHDTTLLREVLDAADASLRTDLTDAPEVRAHFFRFIGWSYHKVLRDDRATADLSESVRIYRTIPRAKLELCSALHWLSEVEAKADPVQAEKDAREAYGMQSSLENSLPPDSPDASALARQEPAIAGILIAEGHTDEGFAMYRDWLAFQKRELGETSKPLAMTLVLIASDEETHGRQDIAEQDFRDSLSIRRKIDGGDSPDTFNSLFHIATVQVERGELAAGEATWRETLAISRTVFPVGDRSITRPLTGLADVLTREGKLDEAFASMEESLLVSVKYSPVRPSSVSKATATVVQALANALDKQGETAKATRLRAQLANPDAYITEAP